jgi:hypothetical protein
MMGKSLANSGLLAQNRSGRQGACNTETALTENRHARTIMAERQIRPIRVYGQVAYVPLTKGFTAIVSAEDAYLVGRYNWSALKGRGTVYAVRSERVAGKNRTVYMHRAVLSASPWLDVDHIDGDGLNNTRQNLREATRSENSRNRGVMTKNSTGLKGVYENPSGRSWCAKIRLYGKGYYLGSYSTPQEAHAAYAKACADLHGKFGRPS